MPSAAFSTGPLFGGVPAEGRPCGANYASKAFRGLCISALDGMAGGCTSVGWDWGRYNKSMQITVMLGKFASSNQMVITVESSDCLISEVLSEVRSKLHPSIQKYVLLSSEKSGSRTFLAPNPDGPTKLEEHKRLSDYQLTDDCTLWLLCSCEGKETSPESD